MTKSPRRRRWATLIAAAGLVTGLVGAVVLRTATTNRSSMSCPLDATFGRMFPRLPSASWSLDDLTTLAEASIETTHVAPPPDSDLSDEMADIPSGYTYVGQFLDHDVTLDPRPNDLLSAVAPSSLVNHRTPQLDLDSVYGEGPTGSPKLYEDDGVHLRLGAPLSGAAHDPAARDLLRDPANGQALIGDARNDENKIVASFHSIMTRFHNAIADDLRAAHPKWDPATLLVEARDRTTWYYQWAVLTDFLPKIAGQATVDHVVSRHDGRWQTRLAFYNACNGSMPVEFSGATYRFGHSMVRDDYQLNDAVKELPVFSLSLDPRANLGGFQPTPSDFGVDWGYFFDLGGTQPQHAYRLDASLIPALRLLPGQAAGTASTILATRNLLRGEQLGLPSGQDVARAMGIKPLSDDKILVGQALGPGMDTTTSITSLSSAFTGKAPLWTYVLAEAANETFTVRDGKIVGTRSAVSRLGPVGGRIVAETIIGLLEADAGSVLHHPEFTPVVRDHVQFAFSDLVGEATRLTNARP